MPVPEHVEAQHHSDNLRRFEQLEATNARLASQQEVLAAQQETMSAAMQKLAFDLHAMKGTIAANTAFTQETLAGIDLIKMQMAQLVQLDVPSLKEIAEAVGNMKGGIRVLGWLERPAKWFAVMAGAVAAGLALYVKWKAK